MLIRSPNTRLQSNILLSPPPEVVNISGEDYPINSDFRVVLRFYELQRDGRVFERHKGIVALKLFFPRIPPDFASAYERIGYFISCGREAPQARKAAKRPDFDFYYDAPLIVSSFWACYGIDLSTARLHWWIFSALLSGLGEDTALRRVIRIRTQSEEGLSPQAKLELREAQKLWSLPVIEDKRTKQLTDALARGDARAIERALQ
ncbi:conserved hypothetical protein [Gammaproteobacteria bacterium]